MIANTHSTPNAFISDLTSRNRYFCSFWSADKQLSDEHRTRSAPNLDVMAAFEMPARGTAATADGADANQQPEHANNERNCSVDHKPNLQQLEH